MLADIIEGMIALSAYTAMNRSDTRMIPRLSPSFYDAARETFFSWWDINQPKRDECGPS